MDDRSNFESVDDNGHRIIDDSPEPPKYQILRELDEMCRRIDNLPADARYAPVTHAELSSVLSVLSALFRAF